MDIYFYKLKVMAPKRKNSEKDKGKEVPREFNKVRFVSF